MWFLPFLNVSWCWDCCSRSVLWNVILYFSALLLYLHFCFWSYIIKCSGSESTNEPIRALCGSPVRAQCIIRVYGITRHRLSGAWHQLTPRTTTAVCLAESLRHWRLAVHTQRRPDVLMCRYETTLWLSLSKTSWSPCAGDGKIQSPLCVTIWANISGEEWRQFIGVRTGWGLGAKDK